ncbi:MAG: hypothetical protein C0497_08490 [Gemmatimonas sp.]|nr:hypothetical protein [Gemmatimonas sp.]
MRRALVALGLFAAVLPLDAAALAAEAAAQVPAGQPGRQRPGAGTTQPRATPTRESLPPGADSTRKDTALVHWVPPDSVANALMDRKGYVVVRYQADFVHFEARDRTITLIGRPAERAVVERAPTTIAADTIRYSDSTNMAVALGPAIVVREAGRDDINASGRTTYDITAKQGIGTNIRTVEQSGERWVVSAHVGGFAGDSATGEMTYGRDGTITSCGDSLPHYHFQSKQIKLVSKSMMVARPAVLYLQGVPVFWLPFVFQDIRSGRRSGVLTPRFGFAELVRNSPTYRRNIENVGYYFALSDYTDLSVSLDWRSAARANAADPGWLRLNSQFHYTWRNRFLSGALAVSRHTLSSGLTNTQVSWNHTQEFSASSRLTSNLNYVTSTTVQRQTALNAMSALATISSMLNYSRAVGPFSVSVGGTRRQYPGREQVDQDFPSVNVSSKAIHIGRFVEWTPSFNSSTSSSRRLDAQGDFKYRYFERNGVLDSTKFDRSTSSSTAAFNSPFKIGKFNLPLSFSFSDRMNDFPEVRLIVNPADTSRRETRIYSRTYLTTLDWRTAVTLPTFFQGTLNLVPSVSIENVDPAGFWVKSERTGNNFVAQRKRLSWGVGVAPTFFGLSRWGIGPVARFRHSINPTLSWSFSPKASVSKEFLEALGKTRAGYLGALAQNRLSLGFNQSFEAKLKKSTSDTSSSEEGKKVKLLSLGFSPLVYDFERARTTGRSGFATDRMNINMNSELLPGLSFDVGYSLFEGSVLSDTARFSPYRESISASMQINRQTPFIRWIARLFGAGSDTSSAPASTDVMSGQFGQGMGSSQQIAGAGMRQQLSAVPTGRGFDASISLSANRQRPPSISTDTSRVKQVDATIQCEAFKANPIQYDVCLRNVRATPPVDYTKASPTTAGGSFFRVPPQTSINWRTSFDLTPKWAVQWSTSYDAVRKEFASHQVTLQRDLHDWRAMFGFTQAPNGNFSFTFFVALKAEPDLKFNYDRASYRQSLVPLP